MALNTNGWDYTYNVNIEKLNALISNEKNSFSTLIVNTIEIADSTSPATILLTISSLNMTDFKVLNTSLYPILDVSMKLSGKLGIYSFADIELKISININWLNKGKINNSITSSDIVVNSTLLTTNLFGGDNLNDFINIFQNYLNGSIAISLSGSGNYSSISNPTIITPTNRDYYGNIYTFFANLNKFSLEVGSEWMKPTTLRFSVKSDVHKDLSDTSCFFSFCCMIGTNTNNDTAFVNINAIPDGSSSALVIERSAFAEYIVLPKLLGAFSNSDLKVSNFDKNVSNTFRFYKDSEAKDKYENDLNLAKPDYKGIYYPSSNWVYKDDTSFYGKLNELNVRVEENLIRITLPKVTYNPGSKHHQSNTIGLVVNQEVKSYQEYEAFVNFSATNLNNIKSTVQTKQFLLNMEHQKSLFSNLLTRGGLQLITSSWSAGKKLKERKNSNYLDKVIVKSTPVIQANNRERIPGNEVLPVNRVEVRLPQNLEERGAISNRAVELQNQYPEDNRAFERYNNDQSMDSLIPKESNEHELPLDFDIAPKTKLTVLKKERIIIKPKNENVTDIIKQHRDELNDFIKKHLKYNDYTDSNPIKTYVALKNFQVNFEKYVNLIVENKLAKKLVENFEYSRITNNAFFENLDKQLSTIHEKSNTKTLPSKEEVRKIRQTLKENQREIFENYKLPYKKCKIVKKGNLEEFTNQFQQPNGIIYRCSLFVLTKENLEWLNENSNK